MVKLLDCTTRDGGYSTNWDYPRGDIIELINKLNSKNIEYFEIGYRNNQDTENKGKFYCCDKDFLKSFYEQKGSLKLGVMVDVKRISLDDFKCAQGDYLDFVRIATHPQDIEKTLKIAEELHNRNYKVFVHLMEVSNIDTKGYIDLYSWDKKDILESLYFADSFGELTPKQIEYYFTKLEILGYKKISFHAHNKNNLALENTLKTIELGAYSVDVSQTNEGRNGGNLTMEELIKNLPSIF